jgi:hyperosmotically inducible protein
MKKFLWGLMFGLVVGAGGYWYLSGQYQGDLEHAQQRMSESAEKVKGALQETLGEIRVEDVKEELARTGVVVRDKARKAGEAIADAAADARVTAAIKARLLKEPGLSALSVHVETTDGLVTLSGTVNSHEQVARAVKVALETEGVKKVVSTLQVKPAS